jgi:micrococcal nuclease
LKRCFAAAFIVGIVIVSAACALASSGYVASRNRSPFHLQSCSSAQRINPSNAVYYQSREEAINAGHRPCKICKP